MIYAVITYSEHPKVRFGFPSIAWDGKYCTDFAIARKTTFTAIPVKYLSGWHDTKEKAEKSISKAYEEEEEEEECLYGLRRNR